MEETKPVPLEQENLQTSASWQEPIMVKTKKKKKRERKRKKAAITDV
jgi:hypothetical protein